MLQAKPILIMAVALVSLFGCGEETIDVGAGGVLDDVAANGDVTFGKDTGPGVDVGDGTPQADADAVDKPDGAEVSSTDVDSGGIDTGVFQDIQTPECSSDDECSTAASWCTTAACVSGQCKAVPVDDGTTCSASGFCQVDQLCKAGVCQPGTPRVCDDGDLCTADSCDAKNSACVFVPNGSCGGDTCASDADCSDGNPCTQDSCDAAGTCTSMDMGDGNPCDDGNPCTGGEVCSAALCVGKVVACNDGNACTADACDPTTGGCSGQAVADGALCDDGVECSTGEACLKGQCVAKDFKCDDGNPCTKDSCAAVTGACEHTATSGNSCDDANPCTLADTCQSGVCAGVAQNCVAAGTCQSAACNPKTGLCESAPASGGCDDGNPCTTLDACLGGKCVGSDKDCDDNNACTSDSCALKTGTCAHTGIAGCGGGCGQNSDCSSAGPCLLASCSAGKCAQTPLADGSACSDANNCTTADACLAGDCVGTTNTCDDKNPCTVDACSPGTGQCAHAPGANGQVCEDGDACTLSDQCKGGKCQGGTAINCTDSNPCTVDTCNPGSGACGHAATANGVACSDGEVCTGPDACTAGVCVGAVISCDDADPCTVDACKGGTCSHAPIANCGSTCTKDGECNDKNPCTADTCTNAACAHGPMSGTACNDGNACTVADVCSAGTCSGTATVCNDGNLCTKEGCDKSSGACVVGPGPQNVPCDDGNACTTGDVCKIGTCVGTSAASCDDGDACTADSCALGTCLHTPIALCGANCKVDSDCEDANVCTTESCSGGHCISGATSGITCSDGNGCTVGDVCKSSSCQPGPTVSCSDGNACTQDSCDPQSGTCLSQPVASGAACSDGDACTASDACSAGVCQGQATKCDDGDACTADFCQPATGQCVFVTIPKCGSKCKADADCTIKAQCVVGTCTSGQCTHALQTGPACDDKDACTQTDVCTAGQCKGQAIPCDDQNACTKDTCVSATGTCKSAPYQKGLFCDDGNLCTFGDFCSGGTCAGKGNGGCNDKDPCTLDTCDPKTASCTHTPILNCKNP